MNAISHAKFTTTVWHNTLAANRLCQAIFTLNSAATALQGTLHTPSHILSDASQDIGMVRSEIVDHNSENSLHGMRVWFPTGGAVYALWEALNEIRGEHLTLAMIDAGFGRRWPELHDGEKLERAHDHWATLDKETDSISDAYAAYLDRARRTDMERAGL